MAVNWQSTSVPKSLTSRLCCQVLRVEGRRDSSPEAYSIAAASGRPIEIPRGSSNPSSLRDAIPPSMLIATSVTCNSSAHSSKSNSMLSGFSPMRSGPEPGKGSILTAQGSPGKQVQGRVACGKSHVCRMHLLANALTLAAT